MKKIMCVVCMCMMIAGACGYVYQSVPETLRVREGEVVSWDSPVPYGIEYDSNSVEASSAFTDNAVTEQQYQVKCLLFHVFPIKTIEVSEVQEQYYIPSGMPVGIYVRTNGVLVLGTTKVNNISGQEEEPAKYVLQSGDYIEAINGIEVDSKEDVLDMVDTYGAKKMTFTIRRDSKRMQVAIQPVEVKEGEYKLGVWIRSDLAGVGTMTYIDPQGRYGALGHGVSDIDTGTILEIMDGVLYRTNIIDIAKGESGSPGELTGVIDYQKEYCLGQVTGNTEKGVYGTVRKTPEELSEVTKLPIAYKQEIEKGNAQIICMLDGKRTAYDIRITRINYNPTNQNKGIRFEVVDEELIAMTGGIVQGMSGSPIIQDGKLIGAVTHVLVNDPTKGYGIFIENMLEH